MSSSQQDEKQETESVSVFVRPLEVTVAADFTSSSEVQSQSSSNVKPNVPPPPPPKATNTVWSTMTSVIESETSVKRWSTPLIKKEEGTPPGPEDHPQTKEGQAREGNVIGITPNYKIGEGKPKSELTLGKTGYLPNEKGDYKVSMRHEDYKQTIIDPKVQSNAKMPYSSSTLPEAKRQLADDFPSSHSKRSLIKLEPLEQRRFKSVESRPITTSNYLTESVERHRDMEASRLREYLKARESDANKPWNKPGWPGPKQGKNDDESMRELEHIRKSIETLQKKVRASSMQDLHLLSPDEFDKQNPSAQVSPAAPRDNGWLIKMRTNRYLDSTKDTNSLKRHKSVDVLSSKGSGLSLPRDLLDVDSQRPKNADPLHWQLRKEFHLTKYSERRASWSQDVLQPSSSTSSVNRPRHDPPPPPPPPPPPIAEDVHNHPSTNTSPLPPPPQVTTNLQKQRSRSQLLYPPGSTENIASEHRAAERPPERIVYENHPYPPSAHTSSFKINERPQASRDPEEDYPERLMSPPPGHQPRSILKQQHQQQFEYSSSQHHQQYSQQKSEYREEYQQHQHQSNGTLRNNLQPSSSAQQPALTSSAPSSVPNTEYNMRPHTTSFQDLPEEERYRIMQENLQKHRQQKPHAHQNKQPVASFNGPFFRIEEVDGGAGHPHANHEPQRQHLSHYEYDHHEIQQQHSSQLEQMKQMSASEIELDKHYSRQDDRGPAVVVWPPISDHKQRPRSQSVMARNIADPDRIDELRRQKAMERDAMRRREEDRMISMQKQLMAMQIQQQRLYEQQHGVTSPVPMMDEADYHSPQAPQKSSLSGPNVSHQHQHQQPLYSPTPPPQPIPQQLYNDPGPPGPQNVRVFETRPISSMSDMIDPQMTSPNQPTWKRTYLVEKPHDVAKNEILTSGELLEKEQYEVDILKRREAFVEKPDDMPEIHRTGKRWQPPPDKPYVWPTLRRPISVEPGAMMEPIDFGPGVPAEMDDGEYKWAPVINDPGYRHERKNFTPTNSPPLSPRRGGGTGPLDEPAKRQTKYVIQPSSDGSHRPKPAFRKERHAPSGGFYPHAPNAIKVVKRRAQSVQGLASPISQSHEDVEVIHQRNYHRIDPIPDYQPERSVSTTEGRLKRGHHSQTDLRHLNDWEKIYELPPHSSTLVEKEVPRNVDVRRRLNQFEGAIQSGRQSVARANSVDSSHSLPYPPPDYDQTLPVPQSRRSHSQHHLHNQHHHHHHQHQQQNQQQHRQDHNLSRQQVSRRNSVASTRLDTPTGHMTSGSRQQSRQEHSSSRQSRHSLSQSRAASTLALSPTPHGDTPNAQRARTMIARATAPSPTPLSYERARAYVPPPLPTGYRAAQQPPKTEELDRLGRQADELLERSRERRANYKLIDSEIIKQSPEPVPAAYKGSSRDLLESRNSIDTATSARDHDRSGYVTDVSTATWQFSTQSFSPRSVVSVNGAREDILKKPLWPYIPTDLVSVADSSRTEQDFSKKKKKRSTQMSKLLISEDEPRSASMPTLLQIKDDKPRSIMKRRELESREQMMYPTNQNQLVEHNKYQRSQSNVVSKPTITETVQRIEEHRRTEEIERRVQRKERRDRRSRHHSSSRHHSGAEAWENGGYYTERRVASLPRPHQTYQYSNRSMNQDEIDKVVREAYEAADEARRQNHRARSSSLSRGHNGYLPSSHEQYTRHVSTRRDYDNSGGRWEDDQFGRGIAHARYGSLSDSLRRGELKYIPNGDVRENVGGHRSMHKSYSTRDVFNGDGYDRRSFSIA